jgi:hypothetical protein
LGGADEISLDVLYETDELLVPHLGRVPAADGGRSDELRFVARLGGEEGCRMSGHYLFQLTRGVRWGTSPQ